MTGKYYRYVGTGEVGDILPGVGVISKEHIQARDDAHQQAIEASGVYKPTTAPKKADPDKETE
ncbi:hypothetical protein [uncultured Deinococcus sp.]|uniref:hypothetical protein n=1 Tax=uncultured Deinococcus sp. TaxID=158789 RepID=UPI0025D1968E|nr:hypothetical protein [uncultured Deinococcus sp.]